MSRCVIILAMLLVASSVAQAQEKVTYEDHVRPIFVASCVGCHNPDKKTAGLDLSSYASAMAGSSGGKVLEPGDAEMSMIYLVVNHEAEPYMPKNAGKLPAKQIETIKKWIAGGALDSATSMAAAPSKPKVAMAVTTAPAGASTQPGAMPPEMSIEPVVRSDRAGAPLSLAISPRSPLIAIGGQRQILLYHAEKFELLGVLPFPDGLPKALTFSRSGAVLVAGGGEAASMGKVAVFDIATVKRIADIGQESDEVLAADITPDQSMVALGGPGKVVKTFSTTSGQPIHKLTKHTDWITAIAYSPDGVLLASGDRAGNLRVWEAASGNEFHTLAGHKAAVTDLAFRADSNVLVSAGEDGAAKLWDMNSGNEIKNVAAHSGGVLSIDVAPDGGFVTSGRDRVVRIWKPDGSKLKDLPAMSDVALHAVFSKSDGSTVISDDWRGVVRVTNVATSQPVATLDANPPTIAERIAIARIKRDAARAVKDKADAAHAAAVKSANPALAAEGGAAVAAAAADASQGKSATTQAAAAVEAATRQLRDANAELRKWQRARVFSELSAARADLERLADQQQRIDEALKQFEAAERAQRDGPARVAELTQRVAAAQQTSANAAKNVESLKGAIAEREPATTQAAAALKQIEAVRAKSAESKPIVEAAQKAKESLELLSGDLAAMRSSATGAEESAKKAAAELATAEAALASAKAELADAPKRSDDARAALASMLTGDLKGRKERVDQLTAEYEQLRGAGAE